MQTPPTTTSPTFPTHRAMADTQRPLQATTAPTQPGPLIGVSGLYKRYGRKSVLRGVEMSVAAGQVMALLGDNGAGKSTLIRIISGLAKADRGEIFLDGISLKNVGHELRRYIGLVSHAPLLYDSLSAEENLAFFAALYDIQEPSARIATILHEVDLWTRRRDPVRTYSRGMVQRLAIGRAILHNPPVLLLDEPDTGLDQSSAQMLHELIRSLGAGNRAILLSTHNLDRAVEWADSVSLLVGGKIVYQEASAALSGAQLRQVYAEANGAALRPDMSDAALRPDSSGAESRQVFREEA
ncbi:MAG: ABC transporter ATP-binding protein [Caldilineaceae bacterium]|nr:ABC transporter ATP-binding protein [Caldilineaceae bacterium]